MDQFTIDGGRALRGVVTISGSKNAALPILIATLLTDDPCIINNVPSTLRDIRTTVKLLESLGKKVVVKGSAITILAHRPLKTQAPYELVKQMRASVVAAGPLLARFGCVRVPIPGGCTIGLRPIDIHLKGFEAMGACRSIEHGDMMLRADQLRPAHVIFNFPSVGATENIMMAAAAVTGKTIIENAAREPEIVDLAIFLTRLGARVTGAGTSRITIHGMPRLHGATHHVIPDRLEAGTFLLACAAVGGSLCLQKVAPEHIRALLLKLRTAGAQITSETGTLTITMKGRPHPVSIKTAPYPGFPTDLQAPWMALMCLANGKSRVEETIFENRFMHAAELIRMGARISVDGNVASIDGVAALHGAPIMASDIRAGAALLVAAAAASGQTTLARVYHIDRGYEKVENKLRKIGVRIRRSTQ